MRLCAAIRAYCPYWSPGFAEKRCLALQVLYARGLADKERRKAKAGFRQISSASASTCKAHAKCKHEVLESEKARTTAEAKPQVGVGY